MKDIKEYYGRHNNDTCYILGNGPSLNDIDLSSLTYPTFGSNRIYLSGYEPNYYACVNPLVLEQYEDEIRKMTRTIKFIPVKYAGLFPDSVPIDTTLDIPKFGSPEEPMWEGYTVTYVLLQLAYYMGFYKAILLGVDHDFGVVTLPNEQLTAVGPDKNHFHPDYFSGGKQWNAPDLARSELAYSLAKQAWSYDLRKIVNASTRTKLRIFPLDDRLGPKHVKVSAIVSAYKTKDNFRGLLLDLVSQTLQPEIVVVCQDKSQEYETIVDFKEKAPQVSIEIVVTKDIPTVYEAWNLGIKASSGRYITNANTDDRHHPMAYEIMARTLEARPGIDLVYHDSFITWDEPKTFERFVAEMYENDIRLVPGRYEGKPGIFAWTDYSKRALGRGCFIGPQPMWRRSLHQLHGYFNGSMKSAGDYEFWLRCAGESNYFHIGAVLGVYCARMDGIELSDPVTAQEEFEQTLMIHQEPGGVEYTPMGQYLRIDLGDSWVYSDVNQAIHQFKRLIA